MKISLSWLRDYLKTTQTAEQLAETLTRSGIEVKNILRHGGDIPKVVAAQVLSSTQHPNADRLSICKVDDGSAVPHQIVCGAKNYKEGDKILLALPGAILPGGMKIKVGKLRGTESEGMMCSSKELGLGEGAEGIHILPPETTVGTELNALFPSDDVLELEITPNRPDWLGHLGVAREASLFQAGTFGWEPPKLPAIKKENDTVKIEATDACSFYSVRLLSKVRVEESPAWLCQRLEAIGLRAINNIVDIANYVMLETAQPLHAFDAEKIKGTLTVRFAKPGETLLALDEKDYVLTGTDLVIADDAGPQALAGVIGGMASSVTETTTSLLLESAVFDSSVIRAMARTHGITTDAAYRFERGTLPQIAKEASARAVLLMQEITGAVTEEELSISEIPVEPTIISFRNDRCRQLLGVDISDDLITSFLEQLGLSKEEQVSTEEASSGTTYWKIPSWRYDLIREVDLIEEVARLYGIEAIPARCITFAAPSSQADKNYDETMLLRRRLTAQGFYEARTSALIAPDKESDIASITLRNPMGEQQSVLRGSLLPGLLASVKHNFRQGASSIRLFELGKTFQKSSASQEEESLSLGLVMTGTALPLNWRGESERLLDFYDLKGVINQLAPGKMTYCSMVHPAMPLALEILCEGKACGSLGVLAPAQARELMLTGHEYPVVVATLNVTQLQKTLGDASWEKGKELPQFPAVKRDLALILDQEVSYADLEKNFLELGEKHLINIVPFDVFSDLEGQKLPLGKKSIALSLTFQDTDRTLTADEISQVLERIQIRLKEALGAEVRS